MLSVVDSTPQRGQIACNTGRRIGMHGQDRFNRMLSVVA